MEAVPLHLREANEFVVQHHQNSLPPVVGKFALGAAQDGRLVGVAIAGRPVCRRLDDGKTLEVLRVATDGTANACSFLYARCARIACLMFHVTRLTEASFIVSRLRAHRDFANLLRSSRQPVA
jgi:hypothetical protein